MRTSGALLAVALGVSSIYSSTLWTEPQALLGSPHRPTIEASGRVIRVGPQHALRKPSDAARIAEDGDVVEIEAGVYEGDAAVWSQNHLTLRGRGGRAHLKANGAAAQGKAIWVITGDNTLVENIEFSEARVPDRNGAGIRLEGAGLIVRGCYFHDNEMGILTNENEMSDVVIEHSEFASNRVVLDSEKSFPLGHNLYIGGVRSFTLRFSYVHHAMVGHNVKSRAQTNFILYNRLMDEEDGASSYIVDIPDGGTSYLIGNLLQQGPESENPALISYAAESVKLSGLDLYVVNNTLVNDRSSGVFVKSGSPVPAQIINNLFVGPGTIASGKVEPANNLAVSDPRFLDHRTYDYRLLPGSPAVDEGKDPGFANGFPLTPIAEYHHPLGFRPRPHFGRLDVGAYEWRGLNGQASASQVP